MIKDMVKNYSEQIRGVSYKGSDLHDSLSEQSVVLLRANNISENEINFDSVVYVDKSRVSAKQYLRKGDIVVCASSGSKNLVGKAAQVNFDKEVTFGAFLKVVRPQNILNEYLGYYFLSDSYRKTISSISEGANINNIRNEHIDNLPIEIVNDKEQQERSGILEKVYRIIKHKKEQLIDYDQLIKSRFVEMFGEPIINDKNWKQVKLKKLALKIMSGNTPKGGSQVYVDDGILFFRSQNVWKNKIEIDDIAYIDEETHRKMSRSSLKHKDILMTKTGRINTENSSLGRAAMYLGADDKANINGHVYLIRLNEIAAKEFVLFIITTNEYRDYIRSVCVGGIDKRQLNKDHIEDFPIILPPRSMQDDFVKLINQVDKLKFEVQKSLDETQMLFDSLMQEYFG